jgi:hypothetical protein
LAVDNTGSIESNEQHCLDKWFLDLDFILFGIIRFTPFFVLSFRFRIAFNTPAFIASHNSSQHVTSLLNQLVKVQQHGLSVQSLLVRHKGQTNFPVLQIFFQNLTGRLLK